MSQSRNTVGYFKKEVTAGLAVVPSSPTDGFVSIEQPDVTTGQRELLESDALTGSIGMKKPQLGIESASASVTMELRSHGNATLPSEPDFGAIVESGVGPANISIATAVQALPAASVGEMTIGAEGSIKKHDFMIVANTTDGRTPRFAKSLKLAVIAGINDKIDFNEGGAELTATLTAGVYLHGGSNVAGSIGAHIKTQMDLVGAADYTVSATLQSDGSYKYTISSNGATFEIMIATGTNTADNFLKLNLGFGAVDLTGAVSYVAGSFCWGNRVVFNLAMTSAPTAGDVVSAAVMYKPTNEGHAHLTAGFYEGNSSVDGFFEQVIGGLVAKLGLSIETGSIAKMTADIQGLKSGRTALTASPFSPEFEQVEGLTGFNVLSYFGSSQVCANSLSIEVANEVVEKKSFCSATGKTGSAVNKRSITGSINPYADGAIAFYNALMNLTDYEAFFVIGVKDAGGFIVGKTVGIYLPQILITQDKKGDLDGNIIEDITFSAHRGADGTQNELVIAFA